MISQGTQEHRGESSTYPEGPRATKQLAAEGIRVNVTLCFSPTQALLAAKAGLVRLPVHWAFGRRQFRWHGADQADRHDYKNYDFKTQVLVASVRHPQHVVEAALAGGHICTMPYTVFQQLVKTSFDRSWIKKFLADWEAMQKK